MADLGNALGLAKTTVHGILRTLHQVGFVEQDHTGAHYHLSDAFGRLGESYLDPNELRSRAINWADSLASRSGEVVRVGRLVEGKVVVVHHVFRPDDSDQDLDVGTTLPPHATALGKAVLAFDTSGAARPHKLEAYTTRTITDPARLADELAAVRAKGWASEFEEIHRRAGRHRRADPGTRRTGGRRGRAGGAGRAHLRQPPAAPRRPGQPWSVPPPRRSVVTWEDMTGSRRPGCGRRGWLGDG